MELRQLRQFAAVADTLSFSRAAERLHMAQPPLSVAIRKLEEEVGARLLERRSRGVVLTAAGVAALRLARLCLAQADEIRPAALSAAGGESGVLRVGFVGSATYSLLPRLLPAFRRRYPLVELVLREAANLELLALIEEGKIDVGLVRYPTASASALKFEVLERDVFCAVLPGGHRLAGGRHVTLKALAQEAFIGYAATAVPGLNALVMLAFQQAGLTPRVTQQAVQVQTVLSLVESGMGVALVPSVAARLASKSLVFLPVKGMPSTVEISIAMAFHPGNENAALARFCDSAHTAVAQH